MKCHLPNKWTRNVELSLLGLTDNLPRELNDVTGLICVRLRKCVSRTSTHTDFTLNPISLSLTLQRSKNKLVHRKKTVSVGCGWSRSQFSANRYTFRLFSAAGQDQQTTNCSMSTQSLYLLYQYTCNTQLKLSSMNFSLAAAVLYLPSVGPSKEEHQAIPPSPNRRPHPQPFGQALGQHCFHKLVVVQPRTLGKEGIKEHGCSDARRIGALQGRPWYSTIVYNTTVCDQPRSEKGTYGEC